jgi:succinate dehydrogenase/fumarate reductase flavoprotein subunit
MTPFILFLACASPVDSGSGPGETGDSAGDSAGISAGYSVGDFAGFSGGFSAGDSGEVPDDGLPDSTPIAEVDVVVIGSGAGGMGAAWAALDSGATVLVLEREATAGGATNKAASYWAAGTPEQEAAGVVDSAELALEEWAAFTGGGPSDPSVEAFVWDSAYVVSWLKTLGLTFTLSENVAADTGTVRRIHTTNTDTDTGPLALASRYADYMLYQTTATGLVLDGARVAGVWVETATGEEAWVHAQATVIATGGFTRNDALVVASLPKLAAYETWHEAFPTNDGNGLSLGGEAGASSQNMDHIGLYSHAVEDANLGQPEVMVVEALERALVVDQYGKRVADEQEFGSVSMGYRWMDDGPFFAIYDEALWENLNLQGRGFNYEDDPDGLELSGKEYAKLNPVAEGDDPAALADALGVDAKGLIATLELYNSDADTGVDSEHGKPATYLSALDAPPYYGLPLVLGRSKSFGGLATDETGAVIDDAGVPIPGLFAAGEVIGFLGTPAVGYGHNGTVTAAWWSGLRAGTSAAAK